MPITEEMKANPLYDNYFRVLDKMLAEARAKREAGLVMPAGRLSEGRNDLQNYKLGQEWTR